MYSLKKLFENRLSFLTKENIIQLSENSNEIFNVVSGLNKSAFSTLLINDKKENFDYYILFVTRNSKDELEGCNLYLQPFLKSRNLLTKFFSI